MVEVKTESLSTAHCSNHFILLSGCLRNSFAQLIAPLDIDGIGQNWEDSKIPGTWVQYPGLQGSGALGDALTPGTQAGSIAASAHGGAYSHVSVAGGA